jgi:hypothetical protein
MYKGNSIKYMILKVDQEVQNFLGTQTYTDDGATGLIFLITRSLLLVCLTIKYFIYGFKVY